MGKGGSTTYTWDYFGSIAGVVCLGPVDELVAIIIDGREAWPLGGATLVRGTEDYVVVAVSTSTIAYGQLVLFWGTDTQTAPQVLQGGNNNFDEAHPPYKGICYVLLGSLTGGSSSTPLGGFLFGRERPSAPNVEVVVRRKPSQSLLTPGSVATVSRARASNIATVVTAAAHGLATGDAVMITGLGGTGYNKAYAPVTYHDSTTFHYPCTGGTETTASDTGGTVSRALTDKQANLLAFAAEVLTSREGLLLDEDALDDTTFVAAAATLHGRSALAAASPLLPSRKTFRSFAAELAQNIDGWLRYNSTSGLVETGVYAHGTAPSIDAAHTITAAKLTRRPRFRPTNWDDVATEAWVQFVDRERAYKSTSDSASDSRARLVLGWDQALDLQRPWITRRKQAISHAAEMLRTAGRPQTTGTLSVRREHGRLIKPGDYVLVDIQFEPGGAPLYGYFRVKRRRIPFTGPIEIEVLFDETLNPTPYVPDITETPSEPPDVPAIAHARVVECPDRLSTQDPSVLVLPERPDLIVLGLNFWFDTTEAGTYHNLGMTMGFAVRATLRSDLTSSASAVEIATPTQADLTLLDEEMDDLQAADDTLLAFIMTIASGDVDKDSQGLAKLEALSISATELVDAAEYDLTVLRGRQGTRARSFLAVDSEVWIVRRAALRPFYHRDFNVLRHNHWHGHTPEDLYFRLQPFSQDRIRPLSDCDPL